jgi:hypothetical protein
MKNRTHLSTVAAVVLAAGLFVISPSAYADDPSSPIPCAPDACEPAPPCDPQTLVNLGLQIHQWRGRAQVAEARVVQLEDRLAAKRDRVAVLRARVARLRGWG